MVGNNSSTVRGKRPNKALEPTEFNATVRRPTPFLTPFLITCPVAPSNLFAAFTIRNASPKKSSSSSSCAGDWNNRAAS